MLFLTITNTALLGHPPPVCLRPPSVHFSTASLFPPPPPPPQGHWLFVVDLVFVFFLGCVNAHPHARVFAHALTPVLTMHPP